MSVVDDILDYIRSGEADDKNLGLEIEHFVVNDQGEQITFDEITKLIESVAKRIGAKIHHMDGYPVGYYTGEYSVSLEPACQFEISIDPYDDLDKIKNIYEGFIALWEPLFNERGYHFETKGNLPLVELGKIKPDDIPLSAKKRYKYMNEYFEKSGKYGKYMMRASASTQISVDYSSEKDMVRKLSVLQKISPVLMMMMENKTDEDSDILGKKHLLRIQEWEDLDPERTGFFPGSFDKGFGYKKAAEVIFNTPLILLTDRGETISVGSNSASNLYSEGVLNADEADEERKRALIEHFISMGFFHFRIKKYIEIRVADSVPIQKALGYVALIKGIVYSNENLDHLSDELRDIDSEEKIRDAVEKTEKDGFDAVIYKGKTIRSWADHLKEIAGAYLDRTDGEYLKYV